MSGSLGVDAVTTAADGARRFRNGSLLPQDLTEELLKRIARDNPQLNAYYEVFESGARESAA